MNNYVVREPKLPLVIGILGSVFFIPLYILCIIYAARYFSNIGDFLGLTAIFTLSIGLLCFVSIYLILSYFRRKLVIADDILSYTPAIGRSRSFHYSDIKQITLDIQTFVKLISHTGKRLVVEVQGIPQSFVVSKELYSSVTAGDSITLCRRQSIFGVEWVALYT